MIAFYNELRYVSSSKKRGNKRSHYIISILAVKFSSFTHCSFIATSLQMLEGSTALLSQTVASYALPGLRLMIATWGFTCLQWGD